MRFVDWFCYDQPSMPEDLEAALRRMRDEWDERARENARHYVATGHPEWADEEFFASGEAEVDHFIRSDWENICQGRDPRSMRVLEIGCGAGRVTRALAQVFGEVHGVDISGQMVERAKQALEAAPNAFVYQNNGMDLSVLPQQPFDFAFSMIVFQHISALEVVESYFREVSRVLQPGSLFKVQMQGAELPKPADTAPEPAQLPLHWRVTGKIPLPIREKCLRPIRRAVLGAERVPGPAPEPEPDTWVGVKFTPEEAGALTERCGFELRHETGAGEQYYWWWCFKR